MVEMRRLVGLVLVVALHVRELIAVGVGILWDDVGDVVVGSIRSQIELNLNLN